MWAVLAPLMPVRDPGKGGAARKYDDRLVLDAIFFVLRSGCQWRMIPRDLLPWDAAYRWYRCWAEGGTWDRVHDALRDQVRIAAGRDPNPSAGVLDAQSIKTSEGGADRGFDAGKKTTGRKRHLIVDTLGLVLAVAVTTASLQDRHGARRVLDRLGDRFPLLGLLWADGGYAPGRDNTLPAWAQDKLGVLIQIVTRNTDTTGFQVLPRRWVIERTFGWLIRNRRLARDYERLPSNSETMITIATIRLMATRLAGQNTPWSNTTHRPTPHNQPTT